MTIPNRQTRDWDDTTPAEGFAYDVPPAATIARLIAWYRDRAASDAGLALALDAQGLTTAADANRKRSHAYRLTMQCLEALRERCCEPETEFRGHLTAKSRPKCKGRTNSRPPWRSKIRPLATCSLNEEGARSGPFFIRRRS